MCQIVCVSLCILLLFCSLHIHDEKVEDPIDNMSLEEAMEIHANMEANFMEQKMYVIDLEQRLHASGLEQLRMR